MYKTLVLGVYERKKIIWNMSYDRYNKMREEEVLMDSNTLYIIVVAMIGASIGLAAVLLGGKYYYKRFDKCMENNLRIYVIAAIAGSLAGSAFVSFKYRITEIAALLIYIGVMFVIGRIDGREHIIPNKLLAILFCIRSVLYLIELCIDEKRGIYYIKNGISGIVLFGVMLTIYSLFCKGKIGMGDIKAIMLLGYYFGIYRSLAMLFIVLMVALIHMVYMLARKLMSARDETSFGPYIAIGSYVALIFGL